MREAALTHREMQIAELFAWGATKKDVACHLFIAERTVENHARSIYSKTGCSKVNELSAWWFCTKFHISFSLSPLKQQLLAIALILVVLPQAVSSSGNIVRTFRSRTESRAARRRTEDSSTILYL